MTALQVREFPTALYDELRDYAASNHRSIAQQTVIAVERMLHSSDFSNSSNTIPQPRTTTNTLYSEGSCGYEADVLSAKEERQARVQKRKHLFDELDEIPWLGARPTTDDILEIIADERQASAERAMKTTASDWFGENTEEVRA